MSIPKDINFITENLAESELDKVIKWYTLLKEADRNNALFVIQYLHAKGMQSCEPEKISSYSLTNVIGSTARMEENYKDIDFLLIGDNGMYQPPVLYSLDNIWERNLRTRFDYSLDNEILNEEYRSFLCQRMPDRSLVTLIPKSEGTSIHLVLQPGINLEEQWDKVDSKPRIVLDRIKNPTGGFFAVMEAFCGEVFGINSDNPKYED